MITRDPSNAAEQCPDPDNATIINHCKGVMVTADGNYRIELDPDLTPSAENVALAAKSYEFIAANSKPNITADTYIEISSKRRLDKIVPKKNNDGIDINTLSEASVKAVEKNLKSEIG